MAICPNCTEPVEGHADNACVLNALIGLLRDRGELTEDELTKLHASTDVGRLWDALYEVVDDLGNGRFS